MSVANPPAKPLTSKDAADFLGLTPLQLQRLRRSGFGPKYQKLGHRTIRYELAVLTAWQAARTVGNTSEARALAVGGVL